MFLRAPNVLVAKFIANVTVIGSSLTVYAYLPGQDMVLHVRTILLLSTFVCIPPPHVKVHFVHSGSPSCYKEISQ